jgi:predicted DNA-binding transcriptional regulator AlpA
VKDEELDPDQLDDGPTLEEVRSWPATVSVARAATAFGISRSHAYELVKQGEFPARVIPAGNSRRVVTASLVEVLSG